MKVLFPQEIETHYIIPSIRMYFAKFMVENGMSQSAVAAIFGVNRAAIHQYLNNKRGNKITFQKEFVKEIKTASKKIKDKFTFMYQMQYMLSLLRTKYSICKIHQQISPELSNCDPDLVGCHYRGIQNV